MKLVPQKVLSVFLCDFSLKVYPYYFAGIGCQSLWKNQEIQRIFADVNQKCLAGQFYYFLFHEIVNMKPVKNLLRKKLDLGSFA